MKNWYIVQSHSSFENKVAQLIKEEADKAKISDKIEEIVVPTHDVTGEVELPSGTEMVMPGDDAKFKVKLITPIAMSEKLNFAIREGGRTVGAGVVTKIIE